MTSFARLAPRLAGAFLVTIVGLAGTAGTASADKPRRECPPSFQSISEGEMQERFGDAPGFQALFESIDKNGDRGLCGKELRPMFNTVDNVAGAKKAPTERPQS